MTLLAAAIAAAYLRIKRGDAKRSSLKNEGNA
jgi:predicted Ser/Thr protein kinase